MNYPCSHTLNAEQKKSSVVLAFITGLVIVFSSTVTIAGDPIPGVDVELKAPPGGIIATSDIYGRFVGRVNEPGSYNLFTVCRNPKACPAYTMSIKATGTTLKPTGRNTYAFTVERTPVILSGVITTIGTGPKCQDKNLTPIDAEDADSYEVLEIKDGDGDFENNQEPFLR